MGYLCDFCGSQRSIVYCRSDAASLCLSCDRNVHSANALSKRHSRTLSCEKCNSQPAFVRCIEERISLCQNCDWIVHVAPNKSSLNTSSTHKRQAVNCYSGCPSAAELSNIWSFLLDFPLVGDSACEQGVGSMSTTNNRSKNSRGPQEKSSVQDESVAQEAGYQHNEDVGIESMMASLDAKLQNAEQMIGSSTLATPKDFLPGSKGPAACDDDAFYGDLNMDEVDLSIENYEELFGVTYDQEQLFDNDGIDELFGTKEMSVFNCDGYTAEERGLIDRFRLWAKGGDGGYGCTSFRRSNSDRCGTPDGAKGGRGGDVILECTSEPESDDDMEETEEINYDDVELTEPDQQIIVALGGDGGLGNINND